MMTAPSDRADRVVGPYKGAIDGITVIEREGQSPLLYEANADDVPPYSDSSSAVATHERQRRKTKVNTSHATIITIFRERVVSGITFVKDIACVDS